MPLISSDQFSCLLLNNNNTPVTNWFSTAFDALKNDIFGYEFIVREQLSHLMLSVYSELKPDLNQRNSHQDVVSIRVTNILSYIQQHISIKISIDSKWINVKRISKSKYFLYRKGMWF